MCVCSALLAAVSLSGRFPDVVVVRYLSQMIHSMFLRIAGTMCVGLCLINASRKHTHTHTDTYLHVCAHTCTKRRLKGASKPTRARCGGGVGGQEESERSVPQQINVP